MTARATSSQMDPDVASLLLEMVGQLVAELHPEQGRVAVRLDDRFDRELGLDSLGLVELIGRVETAFSVSLGEDVLEGAQTTADLVRAADLAQSRKAEGRAYTPAPGARPPRARVTAAASREPSVRGDEGLEHVGTLIEALDWQVRRDPEHVHVRVLPAGEAGSEHDLTYSELRNDAGAVAAGLWSRGLEPGESVALILPTGREFFVAFIGILLAGGVPVPLYPPTRAGQIEDYLRRQVRTLANARAVILVTVSEARRLSLALRAHVGSLRDCVTPEQLMQAGTVGARGFSSEAEDTALLQYTSGSTAHPKGVVLSHANLLANIRAMGIAAGITPSDVFVSWLPLYHDMGLIGAWLGSLYHGFTLVVMSPLNFLARPQRWLWAIDRYRGTLSAAPNFAYDLCVRRIPDAAIEGLDLSSWRWAFDGAEPVSPSTVERFCQRFTRFGFAREALAPAYGLAEASVGLTLPPPGRGPLVDRVDREAFTRFQRAQPASAGDPTPLCVVSCGRVIPGHELRIVDAAGRVLGERREGRIEFRGPSATSGYFQAPDATAALFDDGWLDSGDVGYLAGAELYVTGRIKDVIVRAGRNVHPDELEEAIGDLPEVCESGVAAFATPDAATGTERIVVLVETPEASASARAALSRSINARVAELAGITLDRIVFVAPNTVLKTASGKIARAANRAAYESGTIGRRPSPAWQQLLRVRWAGVRPMLSRVRRTVRVLAYNAAMRALLVGIGVFIWPVLLVLPRPSLRLALVRRATRILVACSGTTLVTTRTSRLPAHGPYVIVSNHPSFVDGLALTAALPIDLRFAVAEDFSRRPIVGSFLRRIGTVFVARTRAGATADVRRISDALEHGATLTAFPEGALAAVPGLRTFHLGPFVAAARANVPVVPIAIRGTRTILRPGRRLARRGHIEIEVGDPIEPTGSDWHAIVELQRTARAAVLERCGEPDATTALVGRSAPAAGSR